MEGHCEDMGTEGHRRGLSRGVMGSSVLSSRTALAPVLRLQGRSGEAIGGVMCVSLTLEGGSAQLCAPGALCIFTLPDTGNSHWFPQEVAYP